MSCRRGIVGDPPVERKAKVLTVFGKGVVVGSERVFASGCCQYDVEIPHRDELTGRTYKSRHVVDFSQMSILN